MRKHQTLTTEIWDSNYFQGDIKAVRTDEGVYFKCAVVNKQALSANTFYNCILLQSINPSTDIVSDWNTLPAIGTTGSALVGGVIIPLHSNTSALQFYSCCAIPANSTIYCEGLLRTEF